MRLTERRRQELIERGDLVSIKGREFIAIDVLDTPVELAAPEPEPAAEPARTKVKDGGGKADMERPAGSS
jgi:hypothetical protein